MLMRGVANWADGAIRFVDGLIRNASRLLGDACER